MDESARVETEIRELHRFFQSWFNGHLIHADSTLARLRQAWAPPFELRDPDGRVSDGDTLITELDSQFGTFPGLRILIKDVVTLREVANALVARYEEWHIDGEQIDRRMCEATFAQDASAPNGVRWLSLFERRAEASASSL